MGSRTRVEFGEDEYVRVRDRERDRLPAFMRDENRRPEPGPLVLRSRDTETFERPRPRSPSPFRAPERIVERARSVGPGPRRIEDDVRIRHVVREPSRGPAPDRIRFVEPPSRSPSPVRERIRIERERERAPRQREQRERAPSPTPLPRPPTPKVITGPTIEREVITHYRDIDHGIVAAPRPASALPFVRRNHHDTDIDIYTSRSETEVDIHKRSGSRGRERSRSRSRPRPVQAWDDVLVRSDRKHLEVDIEHRRSQSRGPRAHSAAPPATDYDDEADQITSKIDARGRMGEAWNGITTDWAIIDVPPGTERVRMDGAGGASAEVTWAKYSGVRRAKFIPDRDEKGSAVSSSTNLSEARGRDRESRLSVQIIDDDRGGSRDRDVVEVEKVTDRRIAIRNQTSPPRRSETWTEITKDLVCREAIQELNYEFEETDYCYYIVEYLTYDEVLTLVQLSDRIRNARKERAREIALERERRDEWEQHRGRNHQHRRRRRSVDYDDDERIVERETIIYDSRRPSGKGYRR